MACPQQLELNPMKTLSKKSLELAFATPYVMSMRMLKLSTGDFPPSASDVNEFNRMWMEKAEAFSEAWMAMSAETLNQQQKFLGHLYQNPFALWSPIHSPIQSLHSTGKAGTKVLKKGLAPVHRKAVDNANRLSG